MSSPKMEVKCSVDCCHHWKENCCNATGLEVNPMTGKDAPNTSDETACKTFRPAK